jgi:UDP-glucuronate 4-epimerase
VEGVTRVIDNPPKISDKKEIDVSISNTAPYKVYNIGNSSPVQLMEYISAIEKKLNKEAIKEYLPMQPGDVPKTEASVTNLMEDLGYKPSTPIEKGIESFIDWYKTYFEVK